MWCVNQFGAAGTYEYVRQPATLQSWKTTRTMLVFKIYGRVPARNEKWDVVRASGTFSMVQIASKQRERRRERSR